MCTIENKQISKSKDINSLYGEFCCLYKELIVIYLHSIAV